MRAAAHRARRKLQRSRIRHKLGARFKHRARCDGAGARFGQVDVGQRFASVRRAQAKRVGARRIVRTLDVSAAAVQRGTMGAQSDAVTADRRDCVVLRSRGIRHAGRVDQAWATFFMRWLHVTGVMWIGLLWYFNFVQIPSMPISLATAAEAMAATSDWRLLAGRLLVRALTLQPPCRDRYRHVAGADHGV